MADFTPHVVPTERLVELGIVEKPERHSDAAVDFALADCAKVGPQGAKARHTLVEEVRLWRAETSLPSRILIAWGRECDGGTDYDSMHVEEGRRCPLCINPPIPGLLLEACGECAEIMAMPEHVRGPCTTCILPGYRSEWVLAQWAMDVMMWALLEDLRNANIGKDVPDYAQAADPTREEVREAAAVLDYMRERLTPSTGDESQSIQQEVG